MAKNSLEYLKKVRFKARRHFYLADRDCPNLARNSNHIHRFPRNLRFEYRLWHFRTTRGSLLGRL